MERDKNEQYSTAPQMIPKWGRIWPQMIMPENEGRRGVWSSSRGFIFKHKQKQVITNYTDILNFHDEVFFG